MGYAVAVLRSLPVLVPPGMTVPDVALELGLSACMQMSGVEMDGAIDQMWDIRTAVLETATMDIAIEPVPLVSGPGCPALVNLAIYLGNLLDRAAHGLGCDREAVVARALDHPVLHRARPRVPSVRLLRSS